MVIKILQTMHNSPRHPFFIKYRATDPRILRLNEEIDQEEDSLDLPDAEYNLEEALDHYRREEALSLSEAEADPVLRAIWEKFKATGSAQEVSRFFGVPYSYIRRRLKEFRSSVILNYHKLSQ